MKSPKIVVRPHTEIVGLEGGDHLESVRWQNNQTGQIEEHKIRHIFIMTGADPNTHCLNGCVVLDVKGFIKTGPDLSPENLTDARWPLTRQPYLLETSLPGVFAVGRHTRRQHQACRIRSGRRISRNLICSQSTPGVENRMPYQEISI